MPLSQRPFAKASINEFTVKSLAAPATLVCDGLGCFTVAKETGSLQELHVTGGGAASVESPDFQAVNIALGNLKTAFSGTYHAFGFAKYSHRYLAQVQYLFNRRFNLPRLIRASCATTACPMWLTRAAEHSF